MTIILTTTVKRVRKSTEIESETFLYQRVAKEGDVVREI
jgi:hypothetical protein